MAAVLGAALAVGAGAQQDSSGATAPLTPGGARHAASTGGGAMLAIAAPAQAAPGQSTPPVGPRALRLRPAEAGRADGPRLGVMVQQTPDGLLVTEVLDGSLAAAMGIAVQDVLLRVEDERIESVADVQRALAARTPGSTVSATVIRAGEGIVSLSGVLPEPAAPVPGQPGTEALPRPALPEPLRRPAQPDPWPLGPPTDDVMPPFAPSFPGLAPDGSDGRRVGFLGVQLESGAAAADSQDSTPGAPGDGPSAGPSPRTPETDAPGAGTSPDADEPTRGDVRESRTPGVGSGPAPDERGSGAAPARAAPGVKVVAVVPESAAWFAGLEPGDRLLSLDGRPLADGADLIAAVSGKAPGARVDLTWLRDGQQHATTVRLGAREPGGELAPILPGLRRLPFDDPRGQTGVPVVPRLRPALPGLPFSDDGLHAPDGLGFGDLGGLHDEIQQFLDGFRLDASGTQRQSVRVDIRDGRGTLSVTRDGKTDTYTLDDQGQWVQSSSPDTTSPDNDISDT